jgi:hypothetical protein
VLVLVLLRLVVDDVAVAAEAHVCAGTLPEQRKASILSESARPYNSRLENASYQKGKKEKSNR